MYRESRIYSDNPLQLNDLRHLIAVDVPQGTTPFRHVNSFLRQGNTEMSHSNNDRQHRAVLVQVGQWSEEIDEGIAPLIREMWIAGIETFMSCEQDGFGKVWIAFTALEELAGFLNIVAEYEAGAETLYNRMNYKLLMNDEGPAWEYEMFVDDSALFEAESHADKPEDCQYNGPPDFYFTFSVRFPPSDLPFVLTRMQQHNRAPRARA